MNLKYYSTRWERALLFSEMTGFMNVEENYEIVKSLKAKGTSKLV
jgi:hypothetical protein